MGNENKKLKKDKTEIFTMNIFAYFAQPKTISIPNDTTIFDPCEADDAVKLKLKNIRWKYRKVWEFKMEMESHILFSRFFLLVCVCLVVRVSLLSFVG